MQEHIEELREKTMLSKEEFRRLLQLILMKVLIVPNDVLEPYKEEAIEILKDIDIDDAPFIACGLAYSNSVLWSDDEIRGYPL
jgi:predicted nucleic acid-binding protein